MLICSPETIESFIPEIIVWQNGFKNMQQTKNILVRLPNWLGDMVMSTAFIKAVNHCYPHAMIDVIAKKGIDFLLDYFPPHNRRFIFNKEEYKGLSGNYRFGKALQQRKYDIFFCLPDSFSSALMGYATGAGERVGYKKELRSALLTRSLHKKKNLHRVQEYVDLLGRFTTTSIALPAVELIAPATERKNTVLVNINSEARSRRLPKEKAVSILTTLRSNIREEIILIGSPTEKDFVDEVFHSLEDKRNIINRAGKTSLPELIQLLAACSTLLTTDSGPAHIANALGTYTIVLFGAGNENNTAPFNKSNRQIIRLGQLPCEPCTDNTCKRYGVPECLLRLDENFIVQQVVNVMQQKNKR